MKLYEIPLEFAEMEQALIEGDGELTPELEAKFDALLKGGTDKINAACCVLRQLESEEQMADEESKRLFRVAGSRARSGERLKAMILIAVDAMGGKLKTPLFSVWGQNAAERVSIDPSPDSDIAQIAATYPSFVRTRHELAKDTLIAAVKAGEELPNCLTVTKAPGTRFLRVK